MLTIDSVSKSLGEFSLSNVSLSVEDGEYFIVLGPTGAGKTILLETIAGIYTPDAGRIFLNGRDITDVPARERNIGMVYQDYMLFPHLTVEANIGFGLGCPGVDYQLACLKMRQQPISPIHDLFDGMAAREGENDDLRPARHITGIGGCLRP